MAIATSMMILIAKVAGPMLLLSVVVGITVSLIQTVTSIQEQTLTFIPKITSILVAILIFGPYMLHQILKFTTEIFGNLMMFVE
ncbi:MAG: EscS/YscS/HrcS family type III secretion system export apparatus protein [Candidatus Muiribacterium halophilum]|uniref:EscS/YscS/HrcS family type III secretion system export apparatus protein n=1 Tax=Muiribacterium halophilum TaxID=2053465 RepID=A0A2N5ZLL7_MUIH1|nr:MAG: EscS/YscS/HrcS family type III secretion system export apparatus protein [Candidatus Muirbacterium halophilum]